PSGSFGCSPAELPPFELPALPPALVPAPEPPFAAPAAPAVATPAAPPIAAPPAPPIAAPAVPAAPAAFSVGPSSDEQAQAIRLRPSVEAMREELARMRWRQQASCRQPDTRK